MKQIATAAVVAALCGCALQRPATPGASPLAAPSAERPASTGIVYKGGDGSSMEQAVIIKAPNNAAGVDAESDWIRKNHPGWRKGNQALVGGDGGKMYDRIDYTTPQGKTITIYFEVTDFFGKW